MRQPLVAKIAQAGVQDENGLIWPGQVLREAAHRFEGRPVYPLHEARVGGGRHPRSIERWGFLKSVQFIGGDDNGALVGLVVPCDGRIERLLRETTVDGRPWGLSPHISRAVLHKPKTLPSGATPGTRVLLRIDEVTSVDLVERPAIEGARILTEVSGVPILPNDDRVPQLLDGRSEAPGKSPTLATLERRLVALIEAADRTARARARVDRIFESAVADYAATTADVFMKGFTARYGPGPWKVRSVA